MEDEAKAILRELGLPMKLVGGVLIIVVAGFRFFTRQDPFGSGIVVLIGLFFAIWGVIESYKAKTAGTLKPKRIPNKLTHGFAGIIIIVIAALFVLVVDEGAIFSAFKLFWQEQFQGEEETETPSAPTPFASPEENPTLTPPSEIVFNDEFLDNRHGWDLAESRDEESFVGGARISEGQLVFDVIFGEANNWTERVPHFVPQSYVLEFEVEIKQPPPDIPSAISFALGRNIGKDYQLFRIRNNGTYSVVIVDCESDEAKEVGRCRIPPAVWEYSEKIDLSPEQNAIIRLVLLDDTLEIYFNHNHIDTLTEINTNNGDLRLGVWGVTGSQPVVHFDNLSIYELP